MADAATPPPTAGPEAGGGIAAELSRLAGAIGSHCQALAALASLEGKEAAWHYLRIVIAIGAGLVFAVFAYLLLLLFVAFLAATIFHLSWIWICLGLGLLHVAGVACCALYAKSRLRRSVFTATAAELRRDFNSLKGGPR